MPISSYLEDALEGHVLRGVAYTPPSNRYVALYTSDPTPAGTGTEVSGGAYARQAVTFNTSGANASDITFPEAIADWGEVTYIGIKDALTGGNLLFYKALGAHSRIILTGDQLIIKAGQLTVDFN